MVETTNAGGGWKRKLLKGLRGVKRMLRLPLQLDRYIEGAVPAQMTANATLETITKDQQQKFQTLRDGNLALQRLLADVLPKMHQDAQAGRQEVAQLANVALPEMQAAAAEAREEVRRLKHRYAEYYGALVEQLREQNRRLDQLAERQEHVLRLLTTSADVLPLAALASQLPQAG